MGVKSASDFSGVVKTQYQVTPTTRTDGQGGQLQSDNVGNLSTIDKSRDEASGAEKTVELAGPDTKYVTETLVDSAPAVVTFGTYYPSTSGMSMDGYSTLSFTGRINAGTLITSSLTMEVSNVGGTTAADWIQVYFTDIKNNAITGSLFAINAATTSFAAYSTPAGQFSFANVRFYFTGSGGIDNSLKLTTKRYY